MKKLLGAFSALCLSALSLNAFAASYWDSYPDHPYRYEHQYKKSYTKDANRYRAYGHSHGKKVRGEHHNKRHRRNASERSSRASQDKTPPLPQTIAAPGQKTIKIDLSKRVFGAYNGEGHLVKWGRVSGGKNYCADIGRSCRTPTGTFTIYSKKGSECKSSRFPLPNGGAKMPYCMHFHGGYAMHGGHVPNYNASHGCIRMHPEDAKWLNQSFVQVGSTKVKISR